MEIQTRPSSDALAVLNKYRHHIRRPKYNVLRRTPFSELKSDDRQPILYLRGFNDDDHANTLPELIGRIISRFPVLGIVSSGIGVKSRSQQSTEKAFSGVLRTIGPVLAIANPEDTVNLTGVRQIQVDHSTWKNLIKELIPTVSLIFIDAGGGKGLKWELEQAVSDGRHKVIIALPIDKYRERRSPFSYEYVREVISDVLGCAMPRYQGNTQFIRFAASGEPILKSDTRTSLTGQIFGSLPGGLIEVLDEAGYDMRSYKHRLRVILISGALLGLLVWVRYIALNP